MTEDLKKVNFSINFKKRKYMIWFIPYNIHFQYEAKSITPVDEYVCKLSDELKKMAKNELGETEEERKIAIKTLRDWVSKKF
jgi:hypothetical protein